MDKKLSIIIPIMNDYDALSRLLPYLKQHGSMQEILVIEAPTSDKSCQELCQSFGVKYHLSPECGRAIQMNYGASLATNDIFLFLHADVLPPTTFISKINEKMENGVAMGFFAYEFSPSNRWLDFNASFTGKDGLFTGGGDQCHFFTRDAFNKLGGYDEKYIIMEDFALIRKAKKSNIPLSIVQDRAIVSSRKYINNSYLWVNFINFIVFMAFLLGVKPHFLKKIYKRALN